jgi:hypothetical protein
VWVIYWVHCHTANGWANTTPAICTSFTDNAQAVLFITNFTNSGAAIDQDAANFTRAQAHLSVYTFTANNTAEPPAERAI